MSQVAAARESGAFDMLMATLDELSETGRVPDALAPTLRSHLARVRERFERLARTLDDAAPPVAVAQARSAEYQAFAQSLREMAVLEATMQSVAESGQQVLQRLKAGQRGPRAAAAG